MMGKMRGLVMLALVAGVMCATVIAGDAQFFRVVSSNMTRITTLSPSGHIAWSNQVAEGTCTIETTTSLGDTNWVSYVQSPVTSSVMELRVFDPNPPTNMVLIPAGIFSMGDNLGDGLIRELPVHTVYVSAFYMDKYEVTNDKMMEVMQWAYDNGKLTVTSASVRNAEGNAQELLDLDPSRCRITWNGSSFSMKATNGWGYPCVEVTWYGSVAFCNYRTQMEDRTPCYNLSDWSCNFNAKGYRLPTEAEWEKAARGGLNGQRFPWGATIQHARANYYSSTSSTSYSYDTSSTRGFHPDWVDGDTPNTGPVGSFAANGYGLHDMVGNVSEWCNDLSVHSEYGYESSSWSNPQGPTSGSGPPGARRPGGQRCLPLPGCLSWQHGPGQQRQQNGLSVRLALGSVVSKGVCSYRAPRSGVERSERPNGL